jgi:hypothetical protein
MDDSTLGPMVSLGGRTYEFWNARDVEQEVLTSSAHGRRVFKIRSNMYSTLTVMAFTENEVAGEADETLD